MKCYVDCRVPVSAAISDYRSILGGCACLRRDLTLFAPTASAMRRMLAICERFADDFTLLLTFYVPIEHSILSKFLNRLGI
jgi:hypothetical protein